jgi:hypothetical protein
MRTNREVSKSVGIYFLKWRLILVLLNKKSDISWLLIRDYFIGAIKLVAWEGFCRERVVSCY